jgi:hypothetical protein
MGEAAIDTTGSCGPPGVHKPNQFGKENSVGEIRLRFSAGRTLKTNVMGAFLASNWRL